MSIQRSTYVVCDGMLACKEVYEANTDDADDARANAREEGWACYPKGIDWCPACWAKLEPTRAPRNDYQPKSEEEPHG